MFFSNLINNAELIDLGFVGYPFTWSNNRKGNKFVEARIDRALANPDWLAANPRALVYHLASMGSDHSPILLQTLSMLERWR